MNRCGCEIDKECTKISVCAHNEVVEELREELTADWDAYKIAKDACNERIEELEGHLECIANIHYIKQTVLQAAESKSQERRFAAQDRPECMILDGAEPCEYHKKNPQYVRAGCSDRDGDIQKMEQLQDEIERLNFIVSYMRTVDRQAAEIAQAEDE